MNLSKITIPTAYNKMTIKYRRDNDNDLAIIREIFNRNVYEFDMGKITENVVLDVGANIGVFTLFVLAQAHNNTRPIHIYAVEPENNNLEIFNKNMADNEILFEYGSKVTIIEKAISNFNGVSHITDSGGESSLADDGQEVDVITFDTLIKMVDGKIDFTKIDIEQSEVPMLCGAKKKTILQSHYYAVEFDQSNSKEQFLQMINPFISDFSFSTFGVPENGCNVYMENHSW